MGDIKTALETAIPEAAKKSPLLMPNGDPRYWILTYRYGNISSTQKMFRFDGTMVEARMRAIKHCEIMKLKFIHILPAFVDLDVQEGRFLEKLSKGEYHDSEGAYR